MSFLALLFALLIEQARPLSSDNWVRRSLRRWILTVSRSLDAGHPELAWTTWSLAVGIPTLLTLLLHWTLLFLFGWPVAMVWSLIASAICWRSVSAAMSLCSTHL